MVETFEQARQILLLYKRRWACEEAGQFLKSRVGLECFRIRRCEATQRLMILAMLATGFLTWILLRSGGLVDSLFRFTSRFGKETKFVYYRLPDSLQKLARLHQIGSGKIPLEPLKNG